MKRIKMIALFGLLIWSDGLSAQNQQVNTVKELGKVKEFKTVDLLKIYPNPVSEYLNITQQQFDGSTSQLEIIDLSGHTIYEVKETFTQLSIFVGNWQKGIYMVFFRQGDAKVMHKIVVH
ncbi:Por secretion system C-terminal sorting domain-containing protein [Reichenbachiella faecimaris]|uniref:Por secretion system C-terminal sorting domain-containing protein n=1 Tax=Reichenbachiella faecimaris TaxID=692418 RepID=A0A1W2G8G2_REIFA|nr:T9SS type A sorting domain-containing protein [Reichenbachiella faecimaris]SMD32957.1 Por secretion system C-terminal sorting domain-containing protein [Reichenbachiella faecimaris]